MSRNIKKCLGFKLLGQTMQHNESHINNIYTIIDIFGRGWGVDVLKSSLKQSLKYDYVFVHLFQRPL